MQAVHVTPTRNMESIMGNGIFRSPPILDQYSTLMKRDYGSAYDNKKGMVFAFTLDDHEQKWFEHFAYWKVWGNPRNIAINDYWNDWDRFNQLQEIGPSAFKNIIPEAEHLTAFVIDIPDNPRYRWYSHQQSHDMNPQWADMEERYEHNDKPLTLINYDVSPKAIKYIIGTCETVLTKSGKIDTIVNMKRKNIYE